MFLMVYVTLVIGLIGVFSQVYTLQAARMYANQNAVANTMLAWHTVATAYAEKTIHSADITASGCDLTHTSVRLPASNPCTNNPSGTAAQIFVGNSKPTSIANYCNGSSVTSNCWVDQSSFSGAQNFNYYSIVYQSSGNYYLVTFVPPPPTDQFGNKNLCLPGVFSGTTCNGGSIQVGIGFDAFEGQLKKLSIKSTNYGFVNAAATALVSGATVTSGGSAASLQYPLPTTARVPANSIGIVTQISPCSGC